MDGGAWLRVDGTAVDWIYRDLQRVQQAWRDASRGKFAFHNQVGHPLGVPDFAYVGELALSVVLEDSSKELRNLQRAFAVYPPALADALVDGLSEASFLVEVARKAVSRADTTYISGCLFRSVELCAHALDGHVGRWLINEKGAIASAGELPNAPPGFAARAHDVVAHLGDEPDSLEAALAAAADLVRATAAACGRPPP